MSIQVGDKVTVRFDLVYGGTYGIHCNDHMVKLAGKILTVKKLYNGFTIPRFDVEENQWIWTEAMVATNPRNLLQPGFVVELRSNKLFFIVVPTEEGLAFVNDDYDSFSVDKWFTADLKRKDNWKDGDIVAIYGLNRNANHAFEFGKDYRKLIWEEAAHVVELTMDEIAKLAGISVEQLKIKKEK